MKKKTSQYTNEIDLIVLLKIIWNGKIMILFITIISFLLGFGYNFQIPKNYQNSITVKASQFEEFSEINDIQNFLSLIHSNQSNQSNQSYQSYLVKFINELKDYEEFLLSIKNIKEIKKHFSKLKIEDQEIESFKYAKLLKIIPPRKNNKNYIINFTWHDPDEAKRILKDTLNLTLFNLKKKIINDLKQNIEFEKKLALSKDKKRLNFLKEQSSIAKELNIADNQINSFYLSQSSETTNAYNADIAIYLRGYKAIDKEIELIQNRNYQYLKNITQETNKLKNIDIKLVDYNIYLIDVKSLKDTGRI